MSDVKFKRLKRELEKYGRYTLDHSDGSKTEVTKYGSSNSYLIHSISSPDAPQPCKREFVRVAWDFDSLKEMLGG